MRRRELHRVRRQLQHHLLVFGAVEGHQRVHAGSYGHRERLLARVRRDGVPHLRHHCARVELVRLEPETAALDAREREHVINEQLQIAGAAHDGAYRAILRLGDRSVEAVAQQSGVAEHRIQRRAPLVRHGGEKARLRFRRVLHHAPQLRLIRKRHEPETSPRRENLEGERPGAIPGLEMERDGVTMGRLASQQRAHQFHVARLHQMLQHPARDKVIVTQSVRQSLVGLANDASRIDTKHGQRKEFDRQPTPCRGNASAGPQAGRFPSHDPAPLQGVRHLGPERQSIRRRSVTVRNSPRTSFAPSAACPLWRPMQPLRRRFSLLPAKGPVIMSTTTASKPPAIWDDFIDIFVSPSQVFSRRTAAGFGIALLVLTVLCTVLYFGTKSLMQPVFDAEFARQTAAAMKANPQITADQMQKGQAIFDKVGFLTVLIFLPIRVIVVGLVLWLVGKLFDSKLTPSSSFMVSTYASFPLILGFVAGGPIAYLTDPAKLTSRYSVTLSLAKLLDPNSSSQLLQAFAGRVDVFAIWVTILLGVGLYVVGRISKQQAAIGAIIVWLVGTLPAIYGAIKAG